MNNNELYNKNSCCGCGACMQICPRNAISMKKDNDGYIYPNIDENKCIDCKLCLNTCTYNKNNKSREDFSAFYAISNEENILMKSSSGGVFASIAQNIIKKNGLVCGCSMEYENDKLNPKHIFIDSIEELHKLQGSKYVQSNIGNTYKEAKKYLEQERIVLYSGTPCQIMGLKGFLKKKYKNLYTIDLICHGVPSIKIFQDYISFLENKHKIKIYNFAFRDKENGWGLNGRIDYYNEKNLKKNMKIFSNESSYYYLFLKGLLYRKNCYTCPYANDNRPADITIGDYWGIQKEHPEIINNNININKGVSSLIINNKKGEDLIKEYSSGLNLFKSDFKKIQKNNTQLNHPTEYNPLNEILLKLFKTSGYKALEDEFKKIMGIKLIKNKIKNRILKKIKNIINKRYYQ